MRFRRTDLQQYVDETLAQVQLEQLNGSADSYMLECIRDLSRYENLIRHMDFLGWTEAEFLGAHLSTEIPLKVGQRVTIPAGAARFHYVMGKQRMSIVGINHQVVIQEITLGSEKFMDPNDLQVHNPMIVWNNGVMNLWMDMNFCPEANPEYDRLLAVELVR